MSQSTAWAFDWNAFRAAPVVGILRGFTLEQSRRITEAVTEAGLTTLEVTLNTPGAAAQIRELSRLAGGKANIGAGTVTTVAQLDEALRAGASFIVTPVLVEDVIRACKERGVVVFPGAFTPTEVHRAWTLGANLVKIFPAQRLGPAYVKDLKAPLPEVRLLPTGGITLESIPAYRAAGADGFGVGSTLFDPARIAAGDWEWLSERAREFRLAARGTVEV
jgi:2-dehydro-3-deoxyphosphogluconate aldolase/(4S)-4-hydroxy-2-oxoglutarate aldolase